MDFTREPIIETIITPKEGCKLVVRSSKGSGQEEFIADAVEVVSFGRSTLYRSLERPKAFLVPVSDYEILEVREARMVLKNVGVDRAIKIGGGREPSNRGNRGAEKEAPQPRIEIPPQAPVEATEEGQGEGRPVPEKKKDRRRQYRKRRGPQDQEKEEGGSEEPVKAEGVTEATSSTEQMTTPPPSFSSLLEPPPALISETISRYRENAMFKTAFFLTEEEEYKPHDKVEELLNEDEQEGDFTGVLQEPVFVGEHEEPAAEPAVEEVEAEAVQELEIAQPEIVEGEPQDLQ